MTELRMFRTRRGNEILLRLRLGTNDAMMAESAIEADEYGLAEVDLGDGVAVDVGAHIGMVAIALAVDNPKARVIAVEPIPENVELLRENVRANGVEDRVEVVEGAAGRAAGYVTIEYGFAGTPDGEMHRYIGNQRMGEDVTRDSISARSVPLGELARGPVRLLVIDAEGAEYELFARTTVAARREKSLVEEIRGEYHGSFARLAELLEATHDVEQRGEDGLGSFVARVRR